MWLILSLSRNGFVCLSNCDITAHVTERSYLISKFLRSVDSFSERQRGGIVIHLELVLSSNSVVNSTNTRVLLIQPWPLHISLLLWVVVLRVDFSNKVWDLLNALLIISSHLAASKSWIGVIKVSDRFLWSSWTFRTKVIPVLSAPVSGVMIVWVMNDNGSESSCSSLDGSIDEWKFCNVVLIDHAEYGLDFLLVYFWWTHFVLVRGHKFSITIIWNQLECFLLWLSVDGTKRCRNTTWWQTVQVSFFRTFLI